MSYSNDFNSDNGNNGNILKIGATWCNPCKALQSKLEQYGYADKVISLDVDTVAGANAVAEYGIRSVPAVVINSKVTYGDKCFDAIAAAIGDC